MINAKEIKQRTLIAAHLKYEKAINQISEKIKETADNGGFLIYIDPKPLKLDRPEWTSILNVFDNAGFDTGISDNKLLISWFKDLKEINLLENYEKTETN